LHPHSRALIAFLFAIPLTTSFSQSDPTKRLSISNQNAEALRLLDQAKAAALGIADRFQRGPLLDQIGVAQVKAGDLDAAVDTMSRVVPFAGDTSDAIEEALAQLNDLNRAKTLSRKFDRARPFFFFSGIARSLAKKGRIKEAIEIAEQIPSVEIRSYALEDIALQQAISGDDAGAHKTFALARALHKEGLVKAEAFDMAALTNQIARGEEEQVRKKIASWEFTKKFGLIFAGAEQLRQQGNKTRARTWILDALKEVPAGADGEFFKYYAIPTLVKLGEKERASELAASFDGEMRLKGFMAVAVTCAEEKDNRCVQTAVEQMKAAAKSARKSSLIADFVLRMLMLSVSAALIDQGQFQEASRVLASVEERMDNVDSTKPRSQFQRVLMLALNGDFEKARSLALRMDSERLLESYRGNALRITALLQTKNEGPDQARQWATALRNEDRAYALLGVAEALLGIDDVKLRPGAVLLH